MSKAKRMITRKIFFWNLEGILNTLFVHLIFGFVFLLPQNLTAQSIAQNILQDVLRESYQNYKEVVEPKGFTKEKNKAPIRPIQNKEKSSKSLINTKDTKDNSEQNTNNDKQQLEKKGTNPTRQESLQSTPSFDESKNPISKEMNKKTASSNDSSLDEKMQVKTPTKQNEQKKSRNDIEKIRRTYYEKKKYYRNDKPVVKKTERKQIETSSLPKQTENASTGSQSSISNRENVPVMEKKNNELAISDRQKKEFVKPVINFHGATELDADGHFLRHLPGAENTLMALRRQAIPSENFEKKEELNDIRLATVLQPGMNAEDLKSKNQQDSKEKRNFWQLSKEQFDLLFKILIFGSIIVLFIVVRYRGHRVSPKKGYRKY